jgi:hypothetical protein
MVPATSIKTILKIPVFRGMNPCLTVHCAIGNSFSFSSFFNGIVSLPFCLRAR